MKIQSTLICGATKLFPVTVTSEGATNRVSMISMMYQVSVISGNDVSDSGEDGVHGEREVEEHHEDDHGPEARLFAFRELRSPSVFDPMGNRDVDEVE